jgi:NAD(P)-dependent dehydrogenase (short-subunit alcohol dehydrogenase family)
MTTMSELANQTVAIVGASSGIGLAAARAAAARGARVILLSRSRGRLEEAARTIPGRAEVVALDMLDREAVDRTIKGLGPVDHLVLAAAGDELAWRAPITELSTEQVERSLDKLRGYVNVARAAVPVLRPRASITLLSGTSAARPPDGFSVLAAVNAAVVSFGKALALELAPRRVNVVMPDVVDTPRHAGQLAMIHARGDALPARHRGKPEDIADAILFLMTNPYMTGHTLVIDGGAVLA